MSWSFLKWKWLYINFLILFHKQLVSSLTDILYFASLTGDRVSINVDILILIELLYFYYLLYQ